jgi:hypothetical protein
MPASSTASIQAICGQASAKPTVPADGGPVVSNTAAAWKSCSDEPQTAAQPRGGSAINYHGTPDSTIKLHI